MSCYKIHVTTACVEETWALGKNIGGALTGGNIFALTGDLGSGKTSFVQGLARGLDVDEKYYITSPTFTLINEYPGRCTLFHVDLYRIEDPFDYEDIGLYEILHGRGVTAIEWADKLPEDVISEFTGIHFEISGDESRNIDIIACGPENINLLKKIQL